VTFFSPLHSALMIFSRMGADITRNTSAAISNTSSDSTPDDAAAGAGDCLLVVAGLLLAGAVRTFKA
jgi:hypothetical protein